MHRENWDDLRHIIAVAETGSVSAAARRLGVTHGTVLRRIAAFEARHGAPLFERSASGYAILPDKRPVLDAIHDVANAILGVERKLGGRAQAIQGRVRITSTDTLCQTILPGALAHITATFPRLSLSLASSNKHLDFTRSAIDISVRPALSLPDGLFGARAGTMHMGVYGAQGAPDRWLTLDGPLTGSLPGRWILDRVSVEKRRVGADSFLVVAEMIAAGLGHSYLPRFTADQHPALHRRDDLGPELAVPLWVACQSEMAGSARLRAVREALADYVRKRLEPGGLPA